MTPEQIETIFKFMGQIDERTKNILERFDALPCKRDDLRIQELEDYKNQMVGKISIIAIICGAVGWAITTAISWFINR